MNSPDELLEEVKRAVESSTRELADLQVMCDNTAKRLTSTKRTRWTTGSSALTSIAEAFAGSSSSHLEHQQEVLAHFNIAFFGRTGAGKSTLMSAFGQLDGGYVSPGYSDWTKKVSATEWNGCRLWDTPGINGWGRGESRSDLEAKARDAVALADVVLLCFDSQSQQNSEFTKIAAWVREFGKPAIAILNVRNLMWRHPAKAPTESARANQSRSVREHADNIRTELARIELAGTPVIALQSRRALFARATRPFRGPAPTNFENDRETYGVEYLLENSNFPVLERLLVEAIKHGGSELRQRSLREGVRSQLLQLRTKLVEFTASVEADIEGLETRVSRMFSVLGYLPRGDAHRYLATDAGIIAALEEIRGLPFTESLEGSLHRHVRHLVRSHLHPVRAASLRRAEHEVARAVKEGTPLDDELFKQRVHRQAELSTAVNRVWDGTVAFLQREMEVAAGTGPVGSLNIDLEAEGTFIDSVSSFRRRAAIALKGAGLAAGGGAVYVAVPSGVNFWNPAGWAGLVLAGGLSVVSLVARWGGNRLSKGDQQRRAELHSDGLRDALAAVRGHFDSVERRLEVGLIEQAWKIGGPLVVAAASGAYNLHQQSAHANALVPVLQNDAATIPPSANPEQVIKIAQREVQAHHRDRPGDALWLGEDWLTDPTSSRYSASLSTQELLQRYEATREHELAGIAAFLADAWRADDVHRIVNWRQGVPRSGATGARPGKPSVVFVGDYSSGKSSLVRRLLVEAERPVPDTLLSGGGAVTREIGVYELEDVTLVDTPGFQGSCIEHAPIALSALEEASLVVVVLHVNLLIGDISVIEKIANGSSMTVAKLSRMLFVINRADELGVDPITTPEDFLLLRERKASELRDALTSHGIAVNRAQIHVAAADPFGAAAHEVGLTRSQFSEHSAWDGVSALIAPLGSVSDDMRQAAIARSAADVVAGALMRGRLDLGTTVGRARVSARENSKVVDATSNALQDAHLLLRGWRSQLERLIGTEADKAKSKIRQLTTEEVGEIDSVIDAWATDEVLLEKVNDLRRSMTTDLNAWSAEQSSTIGRRIDAAVTVERMAALGVDISAVPGQGFLDQAIRHAGRIGDYGAKAAQATGKRDVVYAAGKAIGVKFKPWGAVKAGARIGKVAPVLAAVAVVADGYSMYAGHNAEKRAEAARNRGVRRIDEQIEAYIAAAIGTVDTRDTLMSELADRAAVVGQYREGFVCGLEGWQSAATVASDAYEAVDALLDAYEKLI